MIQALPGRGCFSSRGMVALPEAPGGQKTALRASLEKRRAGPVDPEANSCPAGAVSS